MSSHSSHQMSPYDTDDGLMCGYVLARLYNVLRTLDSNPADLRSEGPFGKCKRLFRALRSLMPTCFQLSCQSARAKDYYSPEDWIQACQGTICDEKRDFTNVSKYRNFLRLDSRGSTKPLSLRKRRWGDTVLACINSLCNNSEGQDRVNCIVNRCQKRSGR